MKTISKILLLSFLAAGTAKPVLFSQETLFKIAVTMNLKKASNLQKELAKMNKKLAIKIN